MRSPAATPGLQGDSVHLFRSVAHYWDPKGPVSWDLSMTGTHPDWRIGVKKGDKLRVSSTYDSSRASWYESMGIMVVYMADGGQGIDPFKVKPDDQGDVTHGPLPENRDNGGQPTGAPDPTAFPDGQTIDNRATIANFVYMPGDQGASGGLQNPPVVKQGQSIDFYNSDANAQIYHTITSCRAPCNRSTATSYPLADGPVDFDSGQLGYGPQGFTAAANRTDWKTPTDLTPGTYTYFCRVHPFMRGSFRVVK